MTTNETTGRIHSIETFGTVDGPGIRYVVFTQGCQLKCRYCHNRDTWEIGSGRKVTPSELISDVLKYKSFYEGSNGGMTISGGEATLQPKFVEEVFKLAKKNNIHTCLDTNGFVEVEKIKDLLKYTDLVLLDIKHIVDNDSIWLTGQSSEKALQLARYLDDENIPVWIRQVLIPDLTDSEESLILLGDFVKSLSNVDRFEFLPYHEMGIKKWEEMGEEYSLKNIRPANKDDINRAKKISGLA